MSAIIESISRSRRLVRAVSALMLGLLAAGIVGIVHLHRSTIANTEAENHRLALVFAEQTTRAFQAADLVLQGITDHIAAAAIDDVASLKHIMGGSEAHDAMVSRLADLPQIEAFTIMDATGRVVSGSRPGPVPAESYADREYFQHVASMTDTGPHISAPVISRYSHRQAVFLIRRITSHNGVFLGLVMASVRLSYFQSFFDHLGLQDGVEVTILRRDGTELIHYPALDLPTGTKMPLQSPWHQMVSAGGGHYETPGVFDSVGPRFVAVQPVAMYPLVVDVLRVRSSALAHWRLRAVVTGVIMLLAGCGLVLLLRALKQQIGVIERQYDALHASEARVAEQSAVLDTTLENMNQGLMMIDASGAIAVCNRRAMELLDLPAAMMATRPKLTEVVDFQRRRGDFSWLEADEVVSNRSSYERRLASGVCIEVRTVGLEHGGFVRTFTDITARVTAEEMLARSASQDQLTGLANRDGFYNRLEMALAAARAAGEELVVMCLDLDQFKAVNDTLGHEAGDRLLAIAAQRMRGIARHGDILARLGGDEFAIVLLASNLAGAQQMSQRLLEAIRAPYPLGEEAVRVGVSIGMAGYPDDGGTAEQLLRNADVALYKAKAAGRNTWRAYASEDGERERQRRALERDVRSAVEKRDFTLAFQPIRDSGTRRVAGFEALLRWNHAGRGAVSPAEFIPVAEQTGLILPLGRWVIEAACAEAAAWPSPVRLAVNLSPAQFRDRDLTDFLRDVLARTGLAPKRLDLEVTEGLLLDDATDVVTTMEGLRAMGVRMVLDDFGTANSNLSYLRGFPFDVVKIDRSFLRALKSDPKARALVEAIVAMAKALELEVVGEGVETEEQLALLTHLKCRWVQGYLLGHPMSGDEARAVIGRRANLDATAGSIV